MKIFDKPKGCKQFIVASVDKNETLHRGRHKEKNHRAYHVDDFATKEEAEACAKRKRMFTMTWLRDAFVVENEQFKQTA